MLYRESGDFKTSYAKDQQTFPIAFDRAGYFATLAFAVLVVPFLINDYWANAVILPFLIYAIAAIGLNILTGFCGQVSLGSGGFMAVGAYAAYKLMTSFPDMSMIFVILLSGGVTALVGILFGLPSLRIKGFYLAVATLAAQFFLVWLFNKVPWFYNYSATGMINAPERSVFGQAITGAEASPVTSYLFCLGFAFILAWVARNLTRGVNGRKWMAIRDMDIAAEIIGVNPLKTKLTALCDQLFLCWCGWGLAVYGIPWFGRGWRSIWGWKIVSDFVYDHHWRFGIHFWIVCWGSIYGAAACFIKKYNGGSVWLGNRSCGAL